MYLEIREYINQCIKKKSDFTIRVNNSGEILMPTSGFVVSITPLINIGMNLNQIIKYILSRKTIRIEGKDYKLYLGGWFENNKDMLKYDISVVIENKEEAFQIGKHCNQLAIYDLSSKNTIFLYTKVL